MELNNKLDSLATKEDIDGLFERFYAKIKSEVLAEFRDELSSRDAKIAELELRIEKLECHAGTDEDEYGDIEIEDWKAAENEDKEELDLLLIGDSIVRHVDTERLIPGGQTSSNVCLSGKKTADVRLRLKEEACKSDIKNIIIHCASNNIPTDPPAKVAKDLISLAKNVKANIPHAKLFISAVLPKIDSSYLPGINEINYRLYEEQRRSGFHLIQHPQFSQHGCIDMQLFSRAEVQNNRPVHLGRRGIVCFAQNMKSELRFS